MAFESLLGNERIKRNLSAAAVKNRFAHFYLISGPKGSGKHTLARLLTAALLCESEEKPCLQCNVCRKVMGDTHPDCITVEDPEHKNVAVKIIRDARESIFIRPNEGIRKIYLFPQEMGLEGQNALLKVLEEPPSYGVFIILSENPEALLPTVRSRCTELQLTAVEPRLLRPWLAPQPKIWMPPSAAPAAIPVRQRRFWKKERTCRRRWRPLWSTLPPGMRWV